MSKTTEHQRMARRGAYAIATLLSTGWWRLTGVVDGPVWDNKKERYRRGVEVIPMADYPSRDEALAAGTRWRSERA